MFTPDLDLDILAIPDPGVKKAPDPGSATLVTSMSSVADPCPVAFLTPGSWIRDG